MDQRGLDQQGLRAVRISVWIGLVGMFGLFATAWVYSGFFLPPSPTMTADQIVSIYTENNVMLQLAFVAMIAGFTCVAFWGGSLSVLARQLEGRYPVFTVIQVVALAVVTVNVTFLPLVFAVAGYRAGEIPPEITRTINDLGWFMFLYPWSPVTIWLVALGAAILSDKSDSPFFPRWAAYLSFWVAFAVAPAGVMALFKTGPLAWNGVLAYWIPLTQFFVWVIAMTVLMQKGARRQERALAAEAPNSRTVTERIG